MILRKHAQSKLIVAIIAKRGQSQNQIQKNGDESEICIACCVTLSVTSYATGHFTKHALKHHR